MSSECVCGGVVKTETKWDFFSFKDCCSHISDLIKTLVLVFGNTGTVRNPCVEVAGYHQAYCKLQ